MPSRAIPAVVSQTLKRGGIGVLPTDTLYGIVGSALNKKTVERIYALRRRNTKKPMIILIARMGDLARFGIVPDPRTKKLLKRLWPGKVSVILPQPPSLRRSLAAKYAYLDRGSHTLAFRLPAPAWLRAFLAKSGPLVAPSANTEGNTPARTITAAKRYFGDKIQFYIDVGRLDSRPSTLVSLADGKIKVLRAGAGSVR